MPPKPQKNKEVKKIEINLKKAEEVVQNIEHKWYSIEPKVDHDISDTLKKWLDKNDKEKNEIVLNESFKYFVRSYRKAVEQLLNDNAKLYLVEKKTGNDNKKKKQKEEYEFKVKELINTSMKRTLYIKIGDIRFKLIHKPKEGHLGNGILEGVGSYTDIWPIATLLTDCNPILDGKLAEKILTFAQTPFAFTRADLQEINPKFALKEFDYMVETYRRYVTGIAFLYTFLEPARRLEVITENNNKLKVQPNKGVVHASSMILMLKFLRDANLEVNLEDAFSPNSNFILFTQKNVNGASQTKKRLRKESTVTKAISYFFENSNKSYMIEEQEIPNAYDIKQSILNPNSDDEASDDEEGKIVGQVSEEYYDEINTGDIVKCNLL